MCTPVFLASSTTIDDPDINPRSPDAITMSSLDSAETATTTDNEQSPSVSSLNKPQLRRVMRQESLRSGSSSVQALHAWQQQQQQSLPASNTTSHAPNHKTARVEDYHSSGDDLSQRSHVVNHSGSEQAMSDNPATIEAQMWASLGAQDDTQDDGPPSTFGRVVEEIAAEEAREAHHCLDILSVAVDSLDSIDNPFARGRDPAIRARTMILHIREEVDRITQNAASTRQLLQYQDILSERLNRARWERRAHDRFWDTYGMRPAYRM